MKFPDLKHEIAYWKKDYLVLGIDEVGRGAFAGPVVVGGVIFDNLGNKKKTDELLSFGINDSKKLSEKRRENLSNIIQETAIFTHSVFTPVSVINKIGIAKATFVGMRKLVASCLSNFPDKNIFVLTDAFSVSYLRGIGVKNQKAIIHGDAISVSIAAASIIAKVARDNYMRNLALKYPAYGFEKHVGYGTLYHRTAIQTHGLSSIHRKAFCSNYIFQS